MNFVSAALAVAAAPPPAPTAWHYAADTMPRLINPATVAPPQSSPLSTDQKSPGHQLWLMLGTLGMDQPTASVHWTLNPRRDGEQPREGSQNALLVDRDWVRQLQQTDADAIPVRGCRLSARPYTLMMLPDRDQATYLQAVIDDLPEGADIEYTITVVDARSAVKLGPYRLIVPPQALTDQSLLQGDIIGGRAGTFIDPGPAWIGRIRKRDGLTAVTIDLDDIDTRTDGSIPVRVQVGGRWYDADPARVNATKCPLLPLVNVYTDSLTFVIPDTSRREVKVEVFGRRVSEHAFTSAGTARVLITHFAIQALNDLFEEPLAGYDPPRTYMQVTMRDDHSRYSSRPGVPPGEADGYSYGFDMHRRFDVPYHLALNGAVLTMIGHDCPGKTDSELRQLHAGLGTIRSDIEAGLLHPMVAGFGSFRWRWFKGGTLAKDTSYCLKQQQYILGDKSKSNALYPDSRIYVQDEDTRLGLQGADIKYLVLDSSTGYYDNEDSATLPAHLDAGPNYLWKDRRTEKLILFIDDPFKDAVYQGTTWNIGKPARQLRQRLLHLALDQRQHGNIIVYGDDYEHACNDGWFEGTGNMKENFAAFLEWISAHPLWLHILTIAELDEGPEHPIGSMNVKDSLEPAMDPGGATSKDLQGHPFHIDSWISVWDHYPAEWRGGTLGHITGQVEDALLSWKIDNELVETAWLAFLVGNHEQAWMKQPLEAGDPNRTPLGDPESFTISSALQIRNVLVWLKASVWAEWASEQHRNDAPDPCPTYVDSGPLWERISTQPIPGDNPVLDPGHFDGDPLNTHVLYNNRTLVVLDENGGIASHVFVLDADGRPRTVSGTFKCYQFRTRDGLYCDGPMLQNTVWTPNHRYIGSDLGPTEGPQTIAYTDNRTYQIGLDQTVMVNNFDAYQTTTYPAHDGIRFAYQRSPEPPDSLNEYQFTDMLRQDGKARRGDELAQKTVWHRREPFTKTFRLNGTRLTIEYDNVPAGRKIDNELCVDLYRGVMENRVLSRQTDGETVTVSNGEHAASLNVISGGHLTAASRCADLDEARLQDPSTTTEYLTLHRVLTDAIQVEACGGALSYEFELVTPPPHQ